MNTQVHHKRKSSQKTPLRSEHEEQVAVFNWIVLMSQKYPGLENAFAIPNGGHRHKATAARLKAEGVRAGVPDILIPVARKIYHGLFVEMKVKGRYPTPKQLDFMAALSEQGYLCRVCHNVVEFIEVVEDYYE